MPKKRSAEERLAKIVREMGFERAEEAFKLLKAYDMLPAEKKTRKKQSTPIATKTFGNVS